jgi:hypothetical protein
LLRRLPAARADSARGARATKIPTARARRRTLMCREGLTLLLGVSLRDHRGNRFDHTALVIAVEMPGFRWHRLRSALRDQVQQVIARLWPDLDAITRRVVESRLTRIVSPRCAAEAARRARDEDLQRELRSTARELVQAGLFDRRAMRAASARDRSRQIALDGVIARHASSDESGKEPTGGCEVLAALVGDLA